MLGAQRSDSWNELRRRYRARARELHPDVQVHRHGSQRLEEARATRLFTRLQAAWAKVDTPERRAQYDLAHGGAVRPPQRPSKVPNWPGGAVAAVLLRAGPGDLHIAVPGGDWDLTLAQFATQVESGLAPRLLIGDLPPHPEVRQALTGIPFAERGRMAAMVGLDEPFEERVEPGHRVDDEGLWKLDQVRRCLAAWSRAGRGPAEQLPYRDELLFMGRLSLAGYELNLPHPAGLTTASEPRPASRAEALERRVATLLELVVPSPALLMAAVWSGDLEFQAALAHGWLTASAPGGAPSSLRRALAARRARIDHHEPLIGSVLDAPPLAGGALSELQTFPRLWEWLQHREVPDRLPWGDLGPECGRDRRLGDSAARLMARVVRRLAEGPARLALLRGSVIRLRPPAGSELDPRELGAEVESELRLSLGLEVPVAAH